MLWSYLKSKLDYQDREAAYLLSWAQVGSSHYCYCCYHHPQCLTAIAIIILSIISILHTLFIIRIWEAKFKTKIIKASQHWGSSPSAAIPTTLQSRWDLILNPEFEKNSYIGWTDAIQSEMRTVRVRQSSLHYYTCASKVVFQLLWVVYYLFSVAATGSWINPSIIGSLLLILLFQVKNFWAVVLQPGWTHLCSGLNIALWGNQ